MADSIDKLNIDISASASSASRQIDKAVKSLENLGNALASIKLGNISNLAASLAPLSSLSNIKVSKSTASNVNTFADGVSKLKDIETGKITEAANGIVALSTATSNLKASNFNSFSNSVSKLSTGLKGLADNTSFLKGQTNSLGVTMPSGFQTALSSMAGSASSFNIGQDVAANMRDFGGGLNSLVTGAKKLQNVDFNSLASDIQKLIPAIQPLTDEMIRAGSAASNYGTQMKDLAQAAKIANSTKMSNAGGFYNSGALAFKVTNITAGLRALSGVASQIGTFISDISSYVENVNLFTVAMGDFARQAEDFTSELEIKLGVDSGEAMRYMGFFQQLTTSFGTAASQSYVLSKNLTQLGYDLASFYNLDTDVAFQKLQSGLAGEIEPLRRIGIDVSAARMQQELYDLGIQKNVDSLSQADKALLRYISIMEQTTNAQGDMAATLNTPANALRVFSAQISIASRWLGAILIPTLTAVISYAIAFVKAVGMIAKSIASLVHFEMPEITLPDSSGSIGGISSELDDVAESASNAKKKVDYLIGGFDELNIIDLSAGSSSGAGDTDIGNILGDIELPEYDMFERFAETDINEKAEKLKSVLEGILKVGAAVGAAFLTWKIASGLLGNLGTIKKTLSEIRGIGGSEKGGLFAQIMPDVPAEKLAIFAQLAGGLAVAAGVFTFAATQSEYFRLGVGALFDALKALVSSQIIEPLKGLAELIGIDLAAAFENFEMSGEKWTTLVASMGVAVGGIAAALGAPVFGGIVLTAGAVTLALQATGYAASDALEKVDLFAEGVSSETEEKVRPFIETMNELDNTFKSLEWGNVTLDIADEESIKNQLDEIVNLITAELDADQNEALQNLEPLKGMLGAEEYAQMVADTNAYYEQARQTVADNEAAINAIVAQASAEKRALTESERATIETMRQEMYALGVSSLAENAADLDAIQRSMTENAKLLSAEQAVAIMQNAKDVTAAKKAEYEQQYQDTLMELERQRALGIIDQQRYDELLGMAQLHRDNMIATTEQQYNDTAAIAKAKLGEYSQYVDTNNWELLSKAEVFQNTINESVNNWLAGIGESIKTAFSDTIKKFTDWCTDMSTKISTEVPKLIDGIVGWFKGLPDKIFEELKLMKDEVVEIGSWMLDGILEGLKDFGNKIKTFSTGMLNKFKDALGIESPSTLMRDEVGVYMAQGIAEGLKQETGTIVETAQGIADSVQKVFDGIAYDVTVDYMALMNEAKASGDMARYAELERTRNAKIDGEGLSYAKTYEFVEAIEPLGMGITALNETQALFSEAEIERFAQEMELSKLNTDTLANGLRDILQGLVAKLNQFATTQSGNFKNTITAINSAATKITASTDRIRINIYNTYNTYKSYSSGGSSSKAKGYASGGYPQKAQLFYAREDGIPELVGQIGNQTAVANNEQITSAMEQAVYRAMQAALSQSGSSQEINLNIVTELDGETVYKNQQKIANSKGYNFGLGAFART